MLAVLFKQCTGHTHEAGCNRKRRERGWQGCGGVGAFPCCWWDWEMAQPPWNVVSRPLKQLN